MPRKRRVFVDGATYHVYCRIGRGEPVFADESELREFVGVLAEVKERDALTVLAWCVMSNHYHVVIRTALIPLWRTMRLLQCRYSRAFNRRRSFRGPLWQGRYQARIVSDERQLHQVIAYVHLNPVTAGIVRDPIDYRWSGHRELVGDVEEPLADVDEALAVYGETDAAARSAYERAIHELAGLEWVGRAPGGLPWWASRRRGTETGGREPRPTVDALGASTAPERPPLSADEYLRLAVGPVGLTDSELSSPLRGSERTEKRALLALIGAELFGVRVRDMAAAMGRSPGSVSRWISELGERRARDAAFRRTADDATRAIIEAARAAAALRSGFVFESTGSPFPD